MQNLKPYDKPLWDFSNGGEKSKKINKKGFFEKEWSLDFD
jgi:hypothetical protein